jgi:hypothetical protein
MRLVLAVCSRLLVDCVTGVLLGEHIPMTSVPCARLVFAGLHPGVMSVLAVRFSAVVTAMVHRFPFHVSFHSLMI